MARSRDFDMTDLLIINLGRNKPYDPPKPKIVGGKRVTKDDTQRTYFQGVVPYLSNGPQTRRDLTKMVNDCFEHGDFITYLLQIEVLIKAPDGATAGLNPVWPTGGYDQQMSKGESDQLARRARALETLLKIAEDAQGTLSPTQQKKLQQAIDKATEDLGL